jgi:TonB-linked SusC/RagA family outer membrane protein
MKTKFNGFLTLLLALVVQISFAQTKTISGTVSDNSGPLPGVSIVIKGTTSGTETDFDGKYTIKTKTGDILIFRYLGYKMVTKNVGTSNSINANMIENENKLDEVVVVAYGSQTKESLTGSVGVVEAKELDLVRQSNVIQGIVGKVAGVQVISNSGQPGAAPTVRIRGIGSINASNAPLYVVNGVPFQGSITSINQSDIESFSILKDAAAAALYGSRGSNGVIIITTKKGKKGKVSITADFSTTHTSRGSKDYDVIKNPGTFYEGHYQAMKNFLTHTRGFSDAQASTTAADNLIIDQAQLGYQLGYNVYDVPNNQVIDPTTGKINPNANLLYQENWEDYLFRNTFSNRSFVSVNGGSDNSRKYFSLGHEKNQAFLLNSNFERVTANFSIEQTYNEKLKLGGTINYAHTYQNLPDQGGIAGAFSWSRSIGPIYPVFGYELDGTPILDNLGNQIYDFGDGTGGTPQRRNFGSFANPYATVLNDIKKRNEDNINGQVFFRI